MAKKLTYNPLTGQFDYIETNEGDPKDAKVTVSATEPTDPEEGDIRLRRIFIRVVFPAPFGPKRPKDFPFHTARFKLSKARTFV